MKYFKFRKIDLYAIIFLALFILVLVLLRTAPCSIAPHKWELMYQDDIIKVETCVKCHKEKFSLLQAQE